MTNLEHKKGGKACALYLPLGRLWQEDEEGADEQVVGGKGNGEELGGEEGVNHVNEVNPGWDKPQPKWIQGQSVVVLPRPLEKH